MFKANFTLLYRSFESLSSWLPRSFLFYTSSRNNLFWHRLYVKEVRKVALATLKRLNKTTWYQQYTTSQSYVGKTMHLSYPWEKQF